MWRFEREFAQKRIRFVVSLFVVLSILLSVGMFMSSLTLVKQMKALIEVIPSMEYVRNIDEKSGTLKVQSEKYALSRDKKAALAAFRETCAECRSLLFGQLERAKDEYTFENLLKAQLILDSFLNETAGADAGTEKVAVKVKAVSGSVYALLSDNSNRYDITKTLYKSTDVANTQVIISFLIAVFVGGGLFLGAIVFLFYSDRQLEKMDALVKTSMIDSLTGLYNRSYFEQRLAESVNRVERFFKPLAVVMVKVEYPPHLEHAARQVILRELAARLIKSTRVYDVNAMYGEDIFASIIHEVEEKEAIIVVNRLKESFEKKEISGKASEVEKEKSLLDIILFFRKKRHHSFHSYIKVLIGAVVYKEGKYGIIEIIGKAEEALIAAEISKDQFKIISIKGTGKHAEKERRG